MEDHCANQLAINAGLEMIAALIKGSYRAKAGSCHFQLDGSEGWHCHQRWQEVLVPHCPPPASSGDSVESILCCWWHQELWLHHGCSFYIDQRDDEGPSISSTH